MEKLSKFAIAIEDKRQGDDEYGGTESNLAVHKIVENLSADDGQNTELNLYNRNNITNTEIEETIPESGHKITNPRCCCKGLAVQVNRVEWDIKLLKSRMDIRETGEDIFGCSTITCLSEKNCLRKDLDKANSLIEELKSKIKCLEDEKSSLTTVIRIIQEDNPQRTKLNCSKNNHADEKYAEVENKKKTRKHRKHKKTPEKPILINSVNEENQYEAQVNIQPGNQHTQTETAESIAQTARNDHKTANKTDDQAEQIEGRQHASVAILGDSMLKYVSSAHLSTKANVQVKTFPGARVDDMKFYVKPTLARAPDCVILHIGTNDLKHSSSQNILNSITMLGQQIKKELPTTTLVVSEVITRNDHPNINVKIKKLNTKLSQVCSNNKWKFISHNNISTAHLNPHGLHLNRQGTIELANNFKCFINSND